MRGLKGLTVISSVIIFLVAAIFIATNTISVQAQTTDRLVAPIDTIKSDADIMAYTTGKIYDTRALSDPPDLSITSHDAVVTITPNIANCDELGDTFKINVLNNGPDGLLQVEIYKALAGLSEFSCGPAPTGWSYLPWPGEDRCIYVTALNSTYKIKTGESLNFTFDAVMSSDTCDSNFIVVTVDDEIPTGDRNTYPLTVNIDCTSPVINKTVGNPKIQMNPACDPNAATCDYWIRQDTPIDVTASDVNTCDMGLDYCEYRVTIDGVAGSWIKKEDGNILQFSIPHDEDSSHFIEVRCYDVAGNLNSISETDKVDSTSPETTKTIGEPKNIEGGVEWIDLVTPVTFSTTDGGPICAIGVDKTYWRYQIVDDSYCLAGSGCGGSLDLSASWQEYNGEEIHFPEESCHAIEYYSVDGLGNEEQHKFNCLFADHTPPVITKEIGDPKATCRVDDPLAGTAFFDDIESGVGEWTADGLWHITNYRSYSPENSWAYNEESDHNFDTGTTNSGSLISQDINLGTLVNPELTFWSWEQTECGAGPVDGIEGVAAATPARPQAASSEDGGCGYDVRQIYVSNDNGANWNLAWQSEGPENDWHQVMIDLLPYAGQTIKIKFYFNTGDNILNNYEGWYVDDIAVKSSAECSYVTSNTPITLSCADQLPHPSDHVTIHWKYRVDEGSGFGNWIENSLQNSSVTIYFLEHSVHELEYWCNDIVDKTSQHYTEIDNVDNEAPIISKTMFGSYLGDCPSGTENLTHGDCYVADNGGSGVTVDVWDTPANHAVDMVTCEYQVWWTTDIDTCKFYEGEGYADGKCLIDLGKFKDQTNIVFSHDSTHDLVLTCQDRLGNTKTHTETFLVDSTPPVTAKTYGEPIYSCQIKYNDICVEKCMDSISPESIDAYSCVDECIMNVCDVNPLNKDIGGHIYPVWITSQTNVTLDATDAKVGVDKIYWRNMVIEDAGGWYVCEDASYCNPEYYSKYVNDSTPFTEYTQPFFKNEESCHVIEYYAVDLLGNEETPINHQCVFVDNSVPKTEKAVGEPKVPIMGEDPLPPGSGTVDPEMVDIDLEPDSSFVVHKEVTTGEIAAAAPEIYFFVDTTGSMGSAIDPVKTNIGTILGSIDAKFGAGQYKDFPDDAFAFSNDQSITDDETAVANAINAMFASGGNDGSEGQLYGMYKIATENAAGFGSDATKIIVWFGDAPGHDPVCTAISGEASDIAEANVISALQDAGITVIAISTTTGYPNGLDDDPSSSASDYNGYCTIDGTSGQGTRIASATGGIHLQDVSAGEITNAIIDAIGEVTGTTDVFPDASDCTEKGLDVTFDPPVQTNVSGSQTVTFEETITLPEDAAPGTEIQCDVYFRSGEMGGIIGSERIWVNGKDHGDWYITQNTPITLSCADPEPHPVDHASLWYRYRISDNCEIWGNWTEWIDPAAIDGNLITKTFTFPEDSCHQLEYYCEDALGNTEPVQTEMDIVDTVPPVITPTVVGPQIGTCPATEGTNCTIDTVTKIHVDAVDPQPHPVDNVKCDWHYYLMEDDAITGGQKDVTPPFDITFPEESRHVLTITCRDALNNTAQTTNTYISDHTPPVTTKSYGTPYYTNGTSEWITSNTGIMMSAYDPEPHPAGVDATYYRTTLVADENCRNADACQVINGTGDWQTYDGTFKIPEESCHLIEYYSVDKVNKIETVKKQCTFVDNTPPVPEKSVGEPKEAWDGLDANYYDLGEFCATPGNCWKVTTLTPITLDCSDPEPHPVDHANVFFKVELDGDDVTSMYCTKEGVNGQFDNETGYCMITEKEAPVNFYFGEESEHNLKYYCADALGNEGTIDDEKFKVEGSAFEIDLNKKWNLISVPFVLLNDDPDEVFKNISSDIISVSAYDPTHAMCGMDWCVWTPSPSADTLKIWPGWGYWVLAKNDTTLLIGGSLFSPVVTPPSKEMVNGWNLIGYYNNDDYFGNPLFSYNGPVGNGKPAMCELGSLVNTFINNPKWSALVTYWEIDNPDQWKFLDKYDNMDPGAGYWIEMDLDPGEEELYSFSTTCSLLIA